MMDDFTLELKNAEVQHVLQKLIDESMDESQCCDVEREMLWWKSKEKEMLEAMIWAQDQATIVQCVRVFLGAIEPIQSETLSWKCPILKPGIDFAHIIVGVIRFVRILMSKNGSLNSKDSSTLHVQSSISLIEKLFQTLKSSLSHSSSSQNRSVATFVIQIYLRIFDPSFLYSCLLLLPIIWRQICDLCMLLSLDNALEQNIIQDCTKQLIVMLTDMNAQIHSVLHSRWAKEIHDSTEDIILQNQVKIIVFLLTRLHSLSPMIYKESQTLKMDLFRILCQIRGFEDASRAMLRSNHRQDQIITDCLSKISHKLDQCSERLWFQNEHGQAYYDMIQIFLNMEDEEHYSTKVVENGKMLIQGSWVLGNAHLLLLIMRRLTQIQQKGKRETPLTRISTEYSLSICERILFVILPLCHPWLDSVDTDTTDSLNSKYLIRELMHPMVDCVITCYRSCVLLGQNATVHHTVIRWLSGFEEEHGLSIDLTIVLAHMYIHRLIRCESKNVRNDCNTDSFITLLACLLFDKRTRTSLRKNISILLCRLLKCQEPPNVMNHLHSPSLVALASTLTERAISKILSTESSCFELHGKRKRTASIFADIIHLSRDDVQCVIILLSNALSRPSFWKDYLSSTKDFMNQQYHILLQSSTILTKLMGQSAYAERDKLINVLLVAISCLPGFMLCSASPSDPNMNLVYDNVTTIFTYFLGEKNQTDNLDVCSSILQIILIASARHFHLVFALLSSIYRAKKFDKLSNSFQYRAACLMSSISKLIPHDASTDILSCCSNLFHALSSSPHWPNTLGTMKYFETFASNLGSCHRDYLLRCINPKSQHLVQSRLKGENCFSQLCQNHSLSQKLLENISKPIRSSSFNRRKAISEIDIELVPQSRVFWLQNNSAVLIISPSVPHSDDASFRRLLSSTHTTHDAVLLRSETLRLKKTGTLSK